MIEGDNGAAHALNLTKTQQTLVGLQLSNPLHDYTNNT